MSELEAKLCKLKDFLAGIRSVFIAYSGGAHSTFLVAAGFTKAEIRSLSRDMGLPTWNKPA